MAILRHNKHKIAESPTARWMLLTAGTLLAVPALLPLVAGFLPRLYFETDPRLADGPALLTMFGPAGAVVLHTVSIACAGVALAIAAALGARICRVWLLLAALGVAAAFWQAGRHAENLATMSAWIAGVALALAAAHVAVFAAARRWMAALVVAILVPVGLQAGYDVLVQKPRVLEAWHANEQTFLEQRGIEPGSPSHLLFERRAMSIDATGPFGFSNVLGTLAAGGAVLALCIGVGGVLSRDERGRPATLLALLAGGCGLGAVWFTHSAGSLGAAGVALGVAGLSVLLLRMKARRLTPVFALGAVVVPVAAVLVRAAMGPPDSMAGERSLLFRFHYWEASARLFRDELPGSGLIGVGSNGFAQGYLLHKNPLSPENIASAHNALVDWAVMLGVGGVSWGVLAVWLLASAASGAIKPLDPAEEGTNGSRRKREPADAGPLLRRPHVIAAGVCAAALMGTQYALQSAMMDAELALVWLAGLAGFVVVAAAVGAWERMPGRGLRLGLMGMGVAVLVQSQLDMAFALMATAGTAWFLLGLAAGAGEDVTPAVRPRVGRTCGAVLVGAAALTLLVGVQVASPVVGHQAQLAQASRWLTIGRPYDAVVALERAHAAQPTDPTALRWLVALRRDEMLTHAARGDTANARQAFELALQPVKAQYMTGKPQAATYRVYIGLLREAAPALDDPALLDEAAALQRELAGLAPYNLRDALELGDMLWDRGDHTDAREAYARAMRIDADLYLDTAMQLDPADRARIQARLNARTVSPPSASP